VCQDVVADCALELVECIGQFDPGLSSQYLALYQVCLLSSVSSVLLSLAIVIYLLSLSLIFCGGVFALNGKARLPMVHS